MQIKHGIITEIDEAKATAKVTFPDDDDLVSYDLPVIHHSMGFAKYYSMPAIGMTALCAFLAESGMEDGFIIGSFYNDKMPPGKSGKTHYVAFDDGALVEYDEDAQKMTLKSGGGGIVLDDDVTINKTLKVVDSVDVGATVTAAGDVVGAGVSLSTHLTTGVKSGTDMSGSPL